MVLVYFISSDYKLFIDFHIAMPDLNLNSFLSRALAKDPLIATSFPPTNAHLDQPPVETTANISRCSCSRHGPQLSSRLGLEDIMKPYSISASPLEPALYDSDLDLLSSVQEEMEVSFCILIYLCAKFTVEPF